ncbi:MAG: type I-C CRISPR-associated protein Cas8c/Csd1 [Acidobacteria bacterium]|nr:type I-C CRISPR-associated protein Cas8c/Csd1 [Acidobacteriota bacterium]
MILESLRDLAVREQLVQEPTYENVGVSFAIVLSSEGNFLALLDLRQPEGRRLPKQLSIPRRAGRTVNDQEDFLVDKSEYVFGVEPDGKRKPEKLKIRFELFRDSIHRARAATGHPSLNAVGSFLDSPAAREECLRRAVEEKYKSNDLFCFEVDGEFVHDLPELRSYWSSNQAQAQTSTTTQCVLCGNDRAPVEKHATVKLIGGSTSGVPLVSFNKGAFESYGWSGNDNAPFCQSCADGYSTGLRRCLASNYPDPSDPEIALPRQNTVLSENLTAVYWTDTPAVALLEAVGKLNFFAQEDAAALTAAFSSPWSGQTPGSVEGRFYCLFLQGGQGRAALRGWETESTAKLHRNITSWFAQTSGLEQRPKPLLFLLNSLAVKREGRKLPERFIRSIFLAAVFGRELPLTILSAAVERNKAERQVTPERAALLQAYFIRSTGRDCYMTPEQPPKSVAYQLGRLLAILQEQQRRKDPKLNKNITDRFYTALSTRPASVFPALMSLGRTHTSNLKHMPSTKKEGMFFEAEIAAALKDIYPVPATFSLHEQGEFALGFYHRRHQDIEGAKAYKIEQEQQKEEE